MNATAKQPKKKWMGSKPEHCDVCKESLKEIFVDGRTVWGPWALMCERCHNGIGVGIGLGRGQSYRLATLEKIAG